MDEQFEELAQRMSDDIEKQFSKRFDEAERRLSEGARVHMENLGQEVELLAEGYGATLESIDRLLQRLETKWDTKIEDHDRVPKNHGKRIRKQEGQRLTAES